MKKDDNGFIEIGDNKGCFGWALELVGLLFFCYFVTHFSTIIAFILNQNG